MNLNQNDQKPNQGPDPERPKAGIWTALIITLAVVLIFSWIFNAVSNGQYTETT